MPFKKLYITQTKGGYKCEAAYIRNGWFKNKIKTYLVGTYPTSLEAYNAGAKHLKWKTETPQPGRALPSC